MTSPRDRVAELIDRGRLSTEEGQALIASLAPARRTPLRQWLLDPFERMSASLGGIAVGIAVLAQIGASRLGVRYDGALDVHIGPFAPSWGVTFAELGVGLILTALVTWGAGRLAGARARAVDLLVAVGVARLPLVALGLPLVLLIPDPHALTRQALAGELSPVYALIGLFVLPLVAWFFVLYFRGFRWATGLAGARLWGAFLASILMAEIVSKIALAYV